ncbi:hypothetical protein C1Y63_04180 [Corynebacterium sp. 13CS0277]|uniref:hypothetical protein n=1 Tax=Corynebacterium sp. 13CS0277 TaxID=2071994 RepID=UPI000D02BD6A|nr:hypothetical protein [Corynebacterium sp. 13CS0277]PRQ11846.1 hypothetical protein C1Y63_04180 [Corynebacterium sp. 13CS0277]
MPGAAAAKYLPAAAVVAAAAMVLWPFVLPGSLLARDMVVLPHMALTPQALGLAGAARATPQDALLGLVPFGLEPLVVRLVVLGAAVVGGRAAWASAGPWAAGVLFLNPFVVERLLQGHWSLVVAWFLLPALLAHIDGPWWRPVAALWWASLTPTGAVAATLIGVVAAGSHRRRLLLGAAGVAASLPWLVPSLLHPAGTTITAASVRAFAPSSVVDVLGMGGIWNADATLTARVGALGALASVLLLAAAWRSTPRRLLVLWFLGAGGASALCLFPGAAGTVLTALPGGGLLRDGQKLVLLMLPAALAGAAALRGRRVAAVVAVCWLAGVWGAPQAMEAITPTRPPQLAHLVSQVGERRLLIAPPSTTVQWQGRVVVDPRGKVLDVVPPGTLVVDGETVDPPNPDYVAAAADPVHRVGAVLDDEGLHLLTPIVTTPRPAWAVALTCAWATCGLLLLAAARSPRRRPPS